MVVNSLWKTWLESKSLEIHYSEELRRYDHSDVLFISSGLVKIHQELMHLHRTYKILSARAGDFDRELAVVKKKFSFFHAKFDIESVYGDYHIEGLDIIARSFVITKQRQVIATVNRQFFTIADTYGVEIVSSEDQAFILALAIVIDQVIDENRHNH